MTLGTLRSDDGDGNGDATKAIGLISKQQFARASRFFVHLSAVSARLRRENAQFHGDRGSTQATTKFPLSF